MISVRLSEEEYLALQQVCFATGARSISDLTRHAMHDLMENSNQPAGQDGSSATAEELRLQMDILKQKIEALMERIDASMSPRRMMGD